MDLSANAHTSINNNNINDQRSAYCAHNACAFHDSPSDGAVHSENLDFLRWAVWSLKQLTRYFNC